MRYIQLIEDKGFVDFSPCDAGKEDCMPSHRFGPHVRNYYLIHFVISGKGRYTTSRGEYTLGRGEAFLIKPGEVTVYEADAESPWIYVWVGFRGRLASEFESVGDVFSYDASIVNDIEEALDAEAGKEALVASIVYKLYARLASEKERADYPNRVKWYINSHYMDDVAVADISKSLGINRKYLARIFKEQYGTSVQQFLINKRLHEAKKLLSRGFTVEESARMVGYSDPFAFSKAFKKKYGVSPIKCKNT